MLIRVMWRSPPIGLMKANFDGSTKGNPQRVGCGRVLRYHNPRVVDIVAILVGHLTRHKDKVIVSIYTIKLAIKFSYRNI